MTVPLSKPKIKAFFSLLLFFLSPMSTDTFLPLSIFRLKYTVLLFSCFYSSSNVATSQSCNCVRSVIVAGVGADVVTTANVVNVIAAAVVAMASVL